MVDNQGARSGDHSWVLCNLGTGWYHFDSTRMYDGFECFMLTDSQVQDILTEEIQYIEEICPRIRQLLQKSFHIREE